MTTVDFCIGYASASGPSRRFVGFHRSDAAKVKADIDISIGTFLLIVLVIFLLGGFTGLRGGPGYCFGHGLNGGIGLLLVIVLVLVVLSRI